MTEEDRNSDKELIKKEHELKRHKLIDNSTGFSSNNNNVINDDDNNDSSNSNINLTSSHVTNDNYDSVAWEDRSDDSYDSPKRRTIVTLQDTITGAGLGNNHYSIVCERIR